MVVIRDAVLFSVNYYLNFGMYLDDSQALKAHILQNSYLCFRLTFMTVPILGLQGVTDRHKSLSCFQPSR
jgi:hypothetical protein